MNTDSKNDELDKGHAKNAKNDNHVKIYDPQAFGEKLVFMHKNWSIEKQNEVVNQLSI